MESVLVSCLSEFHGLPNLKTHLDTAWTWACENKLATSAIGLAVYGLWYCYRPTGMPPGPWGIPIFGSQFDVGIAEHITMTEMAKKYGDVFTLWYGGSRYAVVLNSYEAAKEILVTRGGQYQHRNVAEAVALIGVEDEIFCGSHPKVKEARVKAMGALRNSGMADGRWNDTMLREVEELSAELLRNQGQPVNLEQMLRVATSKHQYLLLFGKRESDNDPNNKNLLLNIETVFEGALPLYVLSKFLPYPVKYLSTYLSGYLSAVFAKPVLQNIQREIDIHHLDFNAENIRDICDAYIAADLERSDRKIMAKNLYVFLPDAIFTASSLITWFFIYLIKYPEYQEKLYQEAVNVTGAAANSRHLTLDDRSAMPLTRGFLEEVMRVVSLVGVTTGVLAHQDTHFRGYRIPKGIPVVMNMYAINHDPIRFHDPDSFNPERYISSDGTWADHKAAITFSIGRRSCIAESLMRSIFFIFFANLVKKFTFELAPEEKLPSIDDDPFGFPAPFNLLAHRRT